MSEQLPFPDNEPDLVTASVAKAVRKQVAEVAKKYGSERIAHDGFTATFQLDSRRLLTCRYITKSDELTRGVYVSFWESLTEYEDGSSVQLSKEYQITTDASRGYITERAVHFDADEDEIPYITDEPVGLQIIFKNRWLRKRQAEVEGFIEEFDDHVFYRYQADELTELLSALNESHVVACEDETVDDL
jgi:hypothetical protein